MTEKYLFGDTDLASRRLKVLADAFAASSREFLSEAAGRSIRLAADLGCGPGYTTHMLVDTLQCAQAIGLDNSEPFIRLAEKTATSKVSFRLHDVTNVSSPVSPCDLIYARFLLTHQRNPESLLAKWAMQLSPGGRLLIEEVDSINTGKTLFIKYLMIVEAMLADAGGELYVGPKLDARPTPAGLMKCSSRTACIAVTNELAAKMFSMNIQTWKHTAFVQENYSDSTILELQDGLRDLAASTNGERGVEWRLRQLVYEREK